MDVKHVLCALACIGIAGAGAVVHAAPAVPAGTVTLTIGQATLINAAGEAVPAKPGATVRPGDIIETAASGHVHVRFRDGGLVSVRPGSRLVVEDYRYDADRVADSAVRFRLESGTVRSISGAAAEGAKQRFRLNTPLVAIGVRGTDFVVQTSARQSYAAVKQGAIVVAPLGEGCAADGLGPCSTPTARLLAAGAEGLLVELRNGIGSPEIRPVVALPSPPVRQTETTPAQPSAAAKPAANIEPPAAPAGEPLAVAALNQERLANAVTAVERTPPQLAQPPEPLALVWGRWGDPASSADFALPLEVARERGRGVAAGGPYVLFNSQPTQAAWPAEHGVVGFSLSQVAAHYQKTGEQVKPVAVTGGTLTVDFAERQFRTQMQLADMPPTLSEIRGSGTIGPDGSFNSRIDVGAVKQDISGAVTLDAKSAGYWFQRASASGVVSGITLWGR